jgi:hypothetical protein
MSSLALGADDGAKVLGIGALDDVHCFAYGFAQIVCAAELEVGFLAVEVKAKFI